VPGGAKFSDHHPERDQRERTQPLNGEQKSKKLSPRIMSYGARQWHAQQKPHLGRIKRAGVSLLHLGQRTFSGNAGQNDLERKCLFPVKNWLIIGVNRPVGYKLGS
jgi:hypothetical protein